MDEGDFDEANEQCIIAALTESNHNPTTWQAQCIIIWKQLVEAVLEYNHRHLSRQATVQQQHLQLFEYLADSPDSVLMPREWAYGQEDQRETVMAHKVLMTERLLQQQGSLLVTPD